MSTVKLKKGKITLFHRSDSKYWYAIYKLNGGVRKPESTHCVDLDDAKEHALDRYAELDYRTTRGLQPNTVTFTQAADAWLTELETEVATGSRKPRILVDYRPIVDRYLKPYFGSKKVDAVTTNDIQKYRTWRRDYWSTGPGKKISHIEVERNGQTYKRKLTHDRKGPSNRSVNTENVVIRSIFAHAQTQGWITANQIPTLKSASVTTKYSREHARPHFTKDEYLQIRRYMRNWIKEPDIEEEERWRREAIQDCILILFNSGLRENELHKKDERDKVMRGLRWRDVDEFKSPKGTTLVELHVTGKTGPRSVVPLWAAQFVLERRKQKRCPNHKPDDFVLAYPNGHLVNSFDSGIRRVFAAAGVLKDPKTGKNRTIYSCRHSYATWQIERGPENIAQVAQNMGTSIAMIEKNYYHHSARASATALTGVE